MPAAPRSCLHTYGGQDGVATRIEDYNTTPRVGFQNSVTGLDLGFYAARSYSLMSLPSTVRRLIRLWLEVGDGVVGPGRARRPRWGWPG
jgi:hypothetical protein